jgi:hypothetical protein
MDNGGHILVHSSLAWYGNPKGGYISVRIDGKAVGTVAPLSTRTFPVAAGPHTVQVRRIYLTSGTVQANVPEQGVVKLTVGFPKYNIALRILRASFFPFGALRLEVVPDDESVYDR